MRLAGIQILRLIAAVTVLVQHCYVLVMIERGGPTKGFLQLDLGALGVYLFFAISGYVIALQAEIRPARFALHRIARIYPPYIAAAILGFCVVVARGELPDTIAFDPSILLLPAGHSQKWFAVPYWTLVYEMFFYAVAWLLMCLRAYDLGLIAWTAIILIFSDPSPDILAFSGLLTSPLCLIFIMGAAYAR